MKKLISMVDFVLEQYEKQDSPNNFESIVFDYANFLKQSLELWMFIPCKLVDGVWVVLECPHNYIHGKTYLGWEKSDYSEAKDRVLFKGWELENKSEFTVWIQKENHSICFTDRGKVNINMQNEKNVEDIIKYDFLLTPTALKQIGL